MRTAFFGTPDFAVPSLRVLAERTEVVAVVCQPDRAAGRGQKLRAPPVKRAAADLGLEVLQPRTLRGKRTPARLAELDPELCVVAAYGKILPADWLARPRHGYVNVHASVLPRLRGAAPIHRAVLGREARTGVSIMQLTEGLDEGPVHLVREVEIGPRETAGELHDRLAVLGGEALGEYLDRLLAGALPPPVEQDHAAATYAAKIEGDEARVDWDRPAPEVDASIRGYSPWPGAFTFLRGKRLVLLGSRPASGEGAPGEVLRAEAEGPVVACGGGAVQVTRLKPAGKRAMAAGDWLRGARLEPGERLGDGEG